MGISGVDAEEGQNLGDGAGGGLSLGVWPTVLWYQTSIGPVWYQTGTRVARGCKLLFSVLRTLMQAAPMPPQFDPLRGAQLVSEAPF